MLKKIFSIVLVFSVLSIAQTVGPKVSVQQLQYDFGNIAQGTIVKHQFLISNAGGAQLDLSDVQASCGCTVTNLNKKVVDPGDAAELNVQFDSNHKMGTQEKYIYVHTNDPDIPVLTLRLTGDIVSPDSPILDTTSTASPVIYFPETEHNFGPLKKGDIVDYTFTFKNNGKGTLKIKDITTSCGCTAALASSREILPSQSGTIRVELDTANLEGKISRNVKVTSNDPSNKVKILAIYADVKEDK